MQTEFETKEDIFSRNEPGDLDSINERNKEKLRTIRNNQKAKRSYQKKIYLDHFFNVSRRVEGLVTIVEFHVGTGKIFKAFHPALSKSKGFLI